jgi:hypothetical protein
MMGSRLPRGSALKPGGAARHQPGRWSGFVAAPLPPARVVAELPSVPMEPTPCVPSDSAVDARPGRITFATRGRTLMG